MGHDIAIHREYYRLPEDTLQLAKCSKIMLLMERGEIENSFGKSLSEIEINLGGKYHLLDLWQSPNGSIKSVFSQNSFIFIFNLL